MKDLKSPYSNKDLRILCFPYCSCHISIFKKIIASIIIKDQINSLKDRILPVFLLYKSTVWQNPKIDSLLPIEQELFQR